MNEEVLPEEPGTSPIGLGVAVMTTIAVVTALYLGRAFIVPLLIGILGSYALCPFVDWLQTWKVPRAAGAPSSVSGGGPGRAPWRGRDRDDREAARRRARAHRGGIATRVQLAGEDPAGGHGDPWSATDASAVADRNTG